MLQELTKVDSEAFSEGEHIHDDPVANLGYVLVQKSIVYVTTRLAKSTHQHVILQQTTLSTASWGISAFEKISYQTLAEEFKMCRNGNSTVFSYMLAMAKIFEQLFTLL